MMETTHVYHVLKCSKIVTDSPNIEVKHFDDRARLT